MSAHLSLTLTNEDVAQLPARLREERVTRLIDRAMEVFDEGVEAHRGGRELGPVCVLFSGGNDSTTVAHLFRGRATHAVHANTGIGIEQTRRFVREVCAGWELPLIEKHPPVSYADLVRERGFPGPAQHWKMYSRLKERCLDAARRDLGIARSRKRFGVFIAGRRRDESRRRVDVPLYERDGTITWVSPIAEWTKLDLNTYRLMHRDVPRNVVADLLHMSGECLCGAFSKASEREQIRQWYPEVIAEIEQLEAEIAGRTDIPDWAKRWGEAATMPQRLRQPMKSGPLCSTCEGAA